MFYDGLSNEELTVLLYRKCPYGCFRVTEGNRNTAIACIEISSQGTTQEEPYPEARNKAVGGG